MRKCYNHVFNRMERFGDVSDNEVSQPLAKLAAPGLVAMAMLFEIKVKRPQRSSAF